MSFVDIGADEFDIESEQQVLACAMHQPGSFAAISAVLLPMHFHAPMHREIFAIMLLFLGTGRSMRLVRNSVVRRFPDFKDYIDDLIPIQCGWREAAASILQKASGRGLCSWCGDEVDGHEAHDAHGHVLHAECVSESAARAKKSELLLNMFADNLRKFPGFGGNGFKPYVVT